MWTAPATPEETDDRDPQYVADRLVTAEVVALKVMVQLDRLPDFHGIWDRLTETQKSGILKSLAKIIDKNF